MTLDTRVYVQGEVSPQELFHEMRRLLGAGPQHVYTDAPTQYYGEGQWSIYNGIGQGLPALLDIRYRPMGMLYAGGDVCTEDCEPENDYHPHKPLHTWAEMSIDTAYGYRDEQGRGCGDLHACLVAQIGQWLDEREIPWCWENEFNGEIHGGPDRYERLTDLTKSGADAADWFRTIVAPAIGMAS